MVVSARGNERGDAELEDIAAEKLAPGEMGGSRRITRASNRRSGQRRVKKQERDGADR